PAAQVVVVERRPLELGRVVAAKPQPWVERDPLGVLACRPVRCAGRLGGLCGLRSHPVDRGEHARARLLPRRAADSELLAEPDLVRLRARPRVAATKRTLRPFGIAVLRAFANTATIAARMHVQGPLPIDGERRLGSTTRLCAGA